MASGLKGPKVTRPCGQVLIGAMGTGVEMKCGMGVGTETEPETGKGKGTGAGAGTERRAAHKGPQDASSSLGVCNTPSLLWCDLTPLLSSQGNLGDCKPIKGIRGVYEFRIDFGPRYRIYYGMKGKKIILLLCGGDKGTQNKDIQKAKAFWENYLQSRSKE